MALKRFGYRVRRATHDSFAQFVRESGIGFYPIDNDHTDLTVVRSRNHISIASFILLFALCCLVW